MGCSMLVSCDWRREGTRRKRPRTMGLRKLEEEQALIFLSDLCEKVGGLEGCGVVSVVVDLVENV
jgi:hypothetical protein